MFLVRDQDIVTLGLVHKGGCNVYCCGQGLRCNFCGCYKMGGRCHSHILTIQCRKSLIFLFTHTALLNYVCSSSTLNSPHFMSASLQHPPCSLLGHWGNSFYIIISDYLTWAQVPQTFCDTNMRWLISSNGYVEIYSCVATST